MVVQTGGMCRRNTRISDMGNRESLSRCGGQPEPFSRLAISRTSGCAGNSANSLHLEKGASFWVVHSFRASSFLSRLRSERGRERERKGEKKHTNPPGKPLFFGISDAAEVSPFFRLHRTFRSFDFDVGPAGGFRETRCGSVLLAVLGQRLQKPAGCSLLSLSLSLLEEKMRSGRSYEQSGNEDISIFNPAPREKP